MKKSKVSIRKISTDYFIKKGTEYPPNELMISKEEITLQLDESNKEHSKKSHEKILELAKDGLVKPGEKYWKITYLVPCSENKDFIDSLIVSLLKTRNRKKVSNLSNETIVQWIKEDPKKSDLRKMLIIKSECKYPIELVKDWDKWAKTDEQKRMILVSGSAYAIQQIKNWGSWAKTDSLKELILISRSPHAIKKVKNWAQWAKTDDRKLKILRSEFPKIIQEISDWASWANTDERKIAILRSKCPHAINKIKDWASWANSDDRKKQILASQCAYAVQEISNKEWVKFLKKRNLDHSVFKDRMTVQRVAEIKELLSK